MNQAKNWFGENKSSLKDTKRLDMIFTLRSLNIVNHTQSQLLGFVLDQGLTWEEHIDDV